MSALGGLSKPARRDIEAIADWYRDRGDVRAGEFLADLAECFEAIERFPESHPLVFRDARQARLRRFPYMILYAIRQGRIRGVGCFHLHRDPQIWMARLGTADP